MRAYPDAMYNTHGRLRGSYRGPTYEQVRNEIDRLDVIPALNTAAYMLMVPFVPRNKGRLVRNVASRKINYRRGEIIFKSHYALKCYHGVNMIFRKRIHPFATAYWAQAMMAVKGHELASHIQERFRRRR